MSYFGTDSYYPALGYCQGTKSCFVLTGILINRQRNNQLKIKSYKEQLSPGPKNRLVLTDIRTNRRLQYGAVVGNSACVMFVVIFRGRRRCNYPLSDFEPSVSR